MHAAHCVTATTGRDARLNGGGRPYPMKTAADLALLAAIILAATQAAALVALAGLAFLATTTVAALAAPAPTLAARD